MNIDKYNYDSIAYAKNKCGIYKITNTITNKIYIGQSIDIYKRWKDEMSQAFSDIDNRDYNLVLAKTFRKYASDRQDVMSKFKFEILEECQPDELDIKEIYWIAKYNSCSKKGYNVTLGGKKDYCRTSSSEWLENLDNIEKDLKDDKLQKYAICKKYGIGEILLSHINLGHYKNKSTNNFDYPLRQKHKKSQIRKIVNNRKYIDRCINDSITKENIQIALDKGIISTIKLAQYFKCGKTLFNEKVKELGMRDYIENARQVYRTNRDNYIKQHRKVKPIYQIDISTGNILNTFTSSYQAVKAIGAKGHSNSIYGCCCGKCQKAYGYYWKFKE